MVEIFFWYTLLTRRNFQIPILYLFICLQFIFILAFAAKDILGFYDNFFRILIERKEIKINVFTFHSLKCQKTKNSNPDLYKYVHSKYNTNFNSKAVDLPWGFMKIFFVFGNLEIDSTFVLEDYIRSFTFVNRCFCQITFPLRALSRVSTASTGPAGSWAPSCWNWTI